MEVAFLYFLFSISFFPVPIQHFYVFRSAGGGEHQAGAELLGCVVGGVVKISWSEMKHKIGLGEGKWCLEMWLLKSKTLESAVTWQTWLPRVLNCISAGVGAGFCQEVRSVMLLRVAVLGNLGVAKSSS